MNFMAAQHTLNFGFPWEDLPAKSECSVLFMWKNSFEFEKVFFDEWKCFERRWKYSINLDFLKS